MDPQVWLVGIIVILEAYWPIVTVVAILILGPLLGFVIVAVVGAVRTAVAPHHEDADSVEAGELFSQLDEEPAVLVRDRNDSI